MRLHQKVSHARMFVNDVIEHNQTAIETLNELSTYLTSDEFQTSQKVDVMEVLKRLNPVKHSLLKVDSSARSAIDIFKPTNST